MASRPSPSWRASLCPDTSCPPSHRFVLMVAQSKRSDLSGNTLLNGVLLVAGAEGGGGMVCVLEGEEDGGRGAGEHAQSPGNLL